MYFLGPWQLYFVKLNVRFIADFVAQNPSDYKKMTLGVK